MECLDSLGSQDCIGLSEKANIANCGKNVNHCRERGCEIFATGSEAARRIGYFSTI